MTPVVELDHFIACEPDFNKASPDLKLHSHQLLAITPDHLRNIEKQTKTFEFRSYEMKQAYFAWFYESQGSRKGTDRGRSAITHIARIAPPLRPGELPADKPGIGNQDFNKGKKKSNFAYEILELYKLDPPIDRREMHHRWKLGVPQGRMRLTKRTVQDVLGSARLSTVFVRRSNAN